MGMIRVSNEMVRLFCGEEDVTTWLIKIKLVAKLQGINDQASFIPLYLDGSVLVLSVEMEKHQGRIS